MATRTRKTAEKTTDIEPVSVEDAPSKQVDEQQDDYQYDDSVNGFEDVSDDDGDDADDDGLSIFMDDYADDAVTEDDDEDYDYEDDDDLDTGLRIAFDPSAYGGKNAIAVVDEGNKRAQKFAVSISVGEEGLYLVATSVMAVYASCCGRYRTVSPKMLYDAARNRINGHFMTDQGGFIHQYRTRLLTQQIKDIIVALLRTVGADPRYDKRKQQIRITRIVNYPYIAETFISEFRRRRDEVADLSSNAKSLVRTCSNLMQIRETYSRMLNEDNVKSMVDASMSIAATYGVDIVPACLVVLKSLADGKVIDDAYALETLPMLGCDIVDGYRHVGDADARSADRSDMLGDVAGTGGGLSTFAVCGGLAHTSVRGEIGGELPTYAAYIKAVGAGDVLVGDTQLKSDRLFADGFFRRILIFLKTRKFSYEETLRRNGSKVTRARNVLATLPVLGFVLERYGIEVALGLYMYKDQFAIRESETDERSTDTQPCRCVFNDVIADVFTGVESRDKLVMNIPMPM